MSDDIGVTIFDYGEFEDGYIDLKMNGEWNSN